MSKLVCKMHNRHFANYMIFWYTTSISGNNINLMMRNFLIITQIIVTILVLSKQNFMVMHEKEKKKKKPLKRIKVWDKLVYKGSRWSPLDVADECTWRKKKKWWITFDLWKDLTSWIYSSHIMFLIANITQFINV